MTPDKATGARALDRALDLFTAIVRDQAQSSLGALAAALGLPVSTAYRLVARLEQRGLLTRTERGRYRAGLGLAALAALVDYRAILAEVARPPLRRLAHRIGRTVHLGVFEADMVTYLVKEAGDGVSIFTREDMQLEAYCSGIGKVLLAHLDEAAREAYLAAGPFVRLTANTIVDPDRLRAVLAAVRIEGHAVDRAEIADELHCVAVPVYDGGGQVVAALSASGGPGIDEMTMLTALPDLKSTAADIGARLKVM